MKSLQDEVKAIDQRTKVVEARTAPRVLEHAQQMKIAEVLRPHRGQSIKIRALLGDSDGAAYRDKIAEAFRRGRLGGGDIQRR